MNEDIEKGTRFNRRNAMFAGAGIAAATVGLGKLRQTSAQAVRTGGGIAGGGLVKEARARAHFSLFATRFEVNGPDNLAFVGKFQWVDNSADIRIVSQSIDFYGPVEGQDENYREVRGTAKTWALDDETWTEADTTSGTLRPFVLQLTDDVLGPGTGGDTISVFVGNEGSDDATDDPFYTLSGAIDSGDLEFVTIDLPF